MSAVDGHVPATHLTATIEAAHERAAVALTNPKAGRFDAVAWLSAHLAAGERVIEPLLDRHRLRDADQRGTDRRLTHEMHLLLRKLEQLAAGDAQAPHVQADRLRAELADRLAEHSAAEHDLLDRLAAVLGPADTDALIARYEHAVAHGPTRPHPYVPHRAVLARVTFATDRLRDRVMDVLDARHVPLPQDRRPPRRRTKWADYLLGRMHFGD